MSILLYHVHDMCVRKGTKGRRTKIYYIDEYIDSDGCYTDKCIHLCANTYLLHLVFNLICKGVRTRFRVEIGQAVLWHGQYSDMGGSGNRSPWELYRPKNISITPKIWTKNNRQPDKQTNKQCARVCNIQVQSLYSALSHLLLVACISHLGNQTMTSVPYNGSRDKHKTVAWPFNLSFPPPPPFNLSSPPPLYPILVIRHLLTEPTFIFLPLGYGERIHWSQ